MIRAMASVNKSNLQELGNGTLQSTEFCKLAFSLFCILLLHTIYHHHHLAYLTLTQFSQINFWCLVGILAKCILSSQVMTTCLC